jgi:hypothetical protein
MIIDQKQAALREPEGRLADDLNTSFEMHEASANAGKNFYTSQARTREVGLV